MTSACGLDTCIFGRLASSPPQQSTIAIKDECLVVKMAGLVILADAESGFDNHEAESVK